MTLESFVENFTKVFIGDLDVKMRFTFDMYDFDNDGDKDLLYGDVSYNNLVYLENGKTINSLGRDSIISQDTLFPKSTIPAYMSTWPIGYVADTDGDGKGELIVTK